MSHTHEIRLQKFYNPTSCFPRHHRLSLFSRSAYIKTPNQSSSSGQESNAGDDEDVDQQEYVPVDFGGGPAASEPFPVAPEPTVNREPDAGTLWGLLVLSLTYLHHSTTGFALPALLPIISDDLHLNDSQGALLTAGYTVSLFYFLNIYCSPVFLLNI